MYQGNILNLGVLAPVSDADSGEGILRALNWPELAARLAAARDFRRLRNEGESLSGASFDGSCARYLTALGIGKPHVNPIDLTNGKAAAGKSFGTSLNTTCDRGTQ